MAVKVTGKVSVKKSFDKADKQLRFATAKSLTDLAGLINIDLKNQMKTKFDRPTPFTLNSLFVKPATKLELKAFVGIKDVVKSKASGSPADVLKHQFFGGARKYKRMEGAFRRVGLLNDDEIVVPGGAVQLNAFGNVPNSLIVRLISYFGAFGEQGFKANMVDKSKQRLAKRGTVAASPAAGKDSKYKVINGVVYFYSPGPSRGDLRTRHLAKGIWQKRGIHGIDVSPVLMFVKPSKNYEQRIDIEKTAIEIHGRYFEKIMKENLRNALSTAR